jgi:hypothetical protein
MTTKDIENIFPTEEEIKDHFAISESSCQDPYMIAKEEHNIEGAKWAIKFIADRMLNKKA